VKYKPGDEVLVKTTIQYHQSGVGPLVEYVTGDDTDPDMWHSVREVDIVGFARDWGKYNPDMDNNNPPRPPEVDHISANYASKSENWLDNLRWWWRSRRRHTTPRVRAAA